MEREQIRLYSQVFDGDDKPADFYHRVLSTPLHYDAFLAALVANCHELDDHKRSVLQTLLTAGGRMLPGAIEYPEGPAEPDHHDEDDITNLSRNPSTASSSAPAFSHLDQNLRLELSANILRVLRTLFVALGAVWDTNVRHKTPNAAVETLFSGLDVPNLYSLFKMTNWFLVKLLPNLELEEASPLVLLNMKEIVSLVFDTLRIVTKLPEKLSKRLLQIFASVDYFDAFYEIMVLTNPRLKDHDENSGDDIVPANIKLSLETLLKLLSIIGVLYHTTPNCKKFIGGLAFTENRYIELTYQFASILKLNLKNFYTYSPDLLLSEISNESFLNWITFNTLNWNNMYLNDTSIHDFTGDEETEELLNVRFKALKNREAESYDSTEFLNVTLYLLPFLDNRDFSKFFINDEAFANWLCLLSYNLQYQYKSVRAVMTTKLAFIFLEKALYTEGIAQSTINEFKWKLCHQRAPIVPIGEAKVKATLSYILDNLAIYLRFNLNAKLDVENAINSVRLIKIILTKHDEESYKWHDVMKSAVGLLIFLRRKPISEPLLVETLELLNYVLSTEIRAEILYLVLLNFDKVHFQTEYVNVNKCFEFLQSKFALGDDKEGKISLLDADIDSPDLIDTIKQFEPETVELKIVPLEYNIQDILSRAI